ncbi:MULTISPECIES: iron uptake transporter deferrochelatase/peroxidase subunit [unclassified Microbacterium]|uniref:iron uptake transporter deferrochelatase/peroxidase subunit n=1 Tax=unclassified Microbacterium TaxID=2609290 RepID=UPI000CFCEB46|nr:MULTISPECIES: iron uptake transporter deferrochelatase/peroxidase subunit [unclassified Microbacterium]PQZ61296.1 deferrochelatase/peroxidase EfeB [Microbacterium sp. MYb43]PQZ82507.1 deferrochelatase/peroxidase EfeB [Microbacterium sp. MYb40]PRB23792.1 deferrochelatase/peroxidase EfeB [Microbacterium sp. MYb54]PRB29687.1 deferrochelatase/peroxidase EfeB [Microbacterium sp. MYb50]PRB70954.1 deferrochelatase/peroxidase EfeB [Microbacterium sp. MYb24]
MGEASAPAGLSRRGLLGLAIGGGVAGLAVGAGAGLTGGVAIGRARAADDAHSAYEFFGAHQSGITTPVQDHLHFASFDMMPRTDREDLISLLQDWTYASSRMVQGLEVSATGAVGGPAEAPPDDTGEALGLPAAGLTITFGFGPGLFENEDGDRYGIAAQRPAGLERLPAFLGDDLDPQTSHGDLCIQACADDPQVAVHAIRNLSRIAFGRARLRWSQLGFGKTSRTTATQATPRNLFGFKDGTANILADDTTALTDHVWVSAKDEPAWLAGGSYLVARKIAMLIETWDRVRLSEQDTIIGRDKGEGAPLSGGDEFTAPDFHSKTIDANSHVSLAHPEQNDGIRILRRGYNYVDGNNALGRLDAGLFFLSYQRDPAQFISLQRRLSTDLMNEYIKHVGSGIWAVPAGVKPGSYVGAALFA